MRRAAVSLVLLLGALWTAPAQAGSPSSVPDRFQINVAGTLSTMNTQASVGPPSGGTGVVLAFEDLFNLPVHKGFLEVDATWKYAGRHHVDLGYLNVSRTAKREIESDVQFGGYTFQAGASVEAYFGSRFLYAAYRYDLLQAEPVRISASLGVSATELAARLTGSGGITDENGQSVGGSASAEGKVPLPVPLLGFQLDWAVSPHSTLQTYTRLIGLDTRDISGGMVQWKLHYHYYVMHNLGLGLGYELLDVSLPRYRTEDHTLRFGYGIRGFTFSLKGAF